MNAQIFSTIFLLFLIIHFLVERSLSLLNVQHVWKNKDQIPEIFKGIVSEENYRKSADYTLTHSRFSNLTNMAGVGITLFLLYSSILPAINQKLASLGLTGLHLGVALFFSLILINSLLELPFEIYETFKIEAKFGFNKTTPSLFILDKLKGLLLLGMIGTPFFYALLAFVTYSGKLWWLWAGLFVIGFQGIMMILFPLFIAPLFNRFNPLEAGELKDRLLELAEKCRFTTSGIFIMDGSKRSTHSNAYFTGLGKARRIVLYDTLVQQMNIPELTAVLAHEIGHYKKKHILKMLGISSLLTLAGFFILSLLVDWKPMYEAFGIQTPSIALGMVIFSLTAGSFTFWFSPLMNALSRKHEYEADAYAVEQTQNSQNLESGLMKLFEKNLSNLTPHPAYSAYHYSHPTLIERVKALRNASRS